MLVKNDSTAKGEKKDRTKDNIYIEMEKWEVIMEINQINYSQQNNSLYLYNIVSV